MKHEEVYKLSDLFARYLLGKNGNEDLLTDLVISTLREFNFGEVKDLEIIGPSPNAGFSLFSFLTCQREQTLKKKCFFYYFWLLPASLCWL